MLFLSSRTVLRSEVSLAVIRYLVRWCPLVVKYKNAFKNPTSIALEWIWTCIDPFWILPLILEHWQPNEAFKWMGWLVKGRGPHHCRLLFSIALQSSDQESSRLWDGLPVRCLLWQAVNRMCSQVGLASTPDQDRNMTWATIWKTVASDIFASAVGIRRSLIYGSLLIITDSRHVKRPLNVNAN